EPETTTPPPAAVPPRVSLEKKVAAKAPQLVSLAKTASVVLEKRRLLDTVARVALVLDASGSMSQQYSSGRVQEVVERILPLAVHFDDDGALDCWAFADRELALAPVTLDNVEGYIAREQGGMRQWNRRIGGCNNEPSVIRAVMAKYQGERGAFGFLKAASQPLLPAYVIFISDGGVGRSAEIKRLLVEASALPIFWQFVGIGGSSYGILEDLDTMSGRKVDNANFFALDDLRSVSEAELYERLLGEFPDWLVAARRAGVLS
ncbi:MAG: VWA domain-containing protein, partial [Sphingobacteriia bacterium]|nr:VWA domain-containing protein [Sphingobacteriia bacterium]